MSALGPNFRRWRRSKSAAERPAEPLDAIERDILIRALERHRFNRTAAGALAFRPPLRQMRYRMARLGVNVWRRRGRRSRMMHA